MIVRILAGAFLSFALCLPLTSAAQDLPVPGFTGKAVVYRDIDGIIHITARSERDLIYAQGWAHARDRFFQMDSLRRQASGTLAELLGEGAIGDDVELRSLGLRRAAERSIPVISPESLAALGYYADGVNGWLAAHPLPAEYTDLEITSVPPWEPLDSLTVAKLLAFGLSFDVDVGFTNTLSAYQEAGAGGGFDGEALFFEDMFRSQPFDPASTVPDATNVKKDARPAGKHRAHWRSFDSGYLKPETLRMARDYLQRVSDVPFIGDAIRKRDGVIGSNEWGVAGSHTASGRPIIANDPHLSLDQPATFYQNHLYAPAIGLNVVGSSFAGVPYVVLGQNDRITWGATTNPLDVTDVFQEELVPDPTSEFGLGTVTDGVVEPLTFFPVEFRFNIIGDDIQDNTQTAGGLNVPPFLLTVPRRNNGPVVAFDFVESTALSIQFTGFGATREVDTFRLWNYARDIGDFTEALTFFDFGSQNWTYADIDGNLAYFSSAEIPLREDLQSGVVNGLPPFFIRNGTGGNEWLPLANPEPGQATQNAILPIAEMPSVVNPPAGFFVNANNDPAGNTLDNDPLNETRPGGGIFYLNPGYAIGTRAGRITQALTDALDAGPVTMDDMAQIQSNVRLLDAEFFAPVIVDALALATAPNADPALAALAADGRVAEAVGRLATWDYSMPTGVLEGYDASDVDGVRLPPSADEIAASISATIYSVWRGQFIANTIDAALSDVGLPGPGSSQTMSALRNLVDNFATDAGVGASGIDFFAVTGVSDPDTKLAIKALASLVDALDLLASTSFDAAFAGSTDQDDYRWGRLHRLVFDHPLGAPYSVPDPGGPLVPSFADLPGFAVDGGFGAVDASSHSARANDSNDFTFGSGPVRRYVGQPGTTPGSIVGRTILPGGSSDVVGSPWRTNLAERWLTNDTYPVRPNKVDLKPAVSSFVIVDTTLQDGRGRTKE